MGGARNASWSTSGEVFKRQGSSEALQSRRQQWKPYLADAHFLVALWEEGELPLTLAAAAAALDEPARFVFLGRKSCPPGCPLSRGIVAAGTPRDALVKAAEGRTVAEFSLPHEHGREIGAGGRAERVYGERDWRLDRHTGVQVMERVPGPRTEPRSFTMSTDRINLVQVGVDLPAVTRFYRKMWGKNSAALSDERFLIKTALTEIFPGRSPRPWRVQRFDPNGGNDRPGLHCRKRGHAPGTGIRRAAGAGGRVPAVLDHRPADAGFPCRGAAPGPCDLLRVRKDGNQGCANREGTLSW